MAKGISLHIGLNSVSPQHYTGWSGNLTACEFDANDMFAIAQTNGYNAKKLLTIQATRKATISSIEQAAKTLLAGDIFWITYSGHGGQMPDKNNDEDDSLDETWCLYDGQLIDDELAVLWTKFKKGVRILVLSDSCHSGTVAKSMHYKNANHQGHQFRYMPNNPASATYLHNKTFYDKILEKVVVASSKDIQASVKLISGCMDNQLSGDGAFNGVFTGKLKKVWNGGKYKKSYLSFWKEIVQLMPPDQTPNYYNIGQQSAKFDAEIPFSI